MSLTSLPSFPYNPIEGNIPPVTIPEDSPSQNPLLVETQANEQFSSRLVLHFRESRYPFCRVTVEEVLDQERNGFCGIPFPSSVRFRDPEPDLWVRQV
jgi:hypothetical protein